MDGEISHFWGEKQYFRALIFVHFFLLYLFFLLGILIVLPLKFPAFRIIRSLSRGKKPGEMGNAPW